jgi:hypothetical protein
VEQMQTPLTTSAPGIRVAGQQSVRVIDWCLRSIAQLRIERQTQVLRIAGRAVKDSRVTGLADQVSDHPRGRLALLSPRYSSAGSFSPLASRSRNHIDPQAAFSAAGVVS